MTTETLGAVPVSHHTFAKVARWALAGVAVIAIALVVWRAVAKSQTAHVDYHSVRIDRGAIAAKVTATGTLSALVTVNVGSQVSGRIDTLGADFESTVKKGQVIATIEPSLFKAAAAQARATYVSMNAAVTKSRTQATLDLRQRDRALQLNQEGLMSRSDFDTAQAALDAANADISAALANAEQAKAALDQAQLNLHYCTIISPIDGVVISRNVDIGQTVAAALQAPTLFVIAQDLSAMQVDTNVAEADVGKLRPAMPVTFSVDAYPARSFRGTVRQVRDNAQTIQNVVTYDAVIDVDNSERLLKPGMTANVTFVYANRTDALRAPTTALRFKPDAAVLALMKAPTAPPVRADQRIIWVLRNGSAVPVAVDIGVTDGTYTEVMQGDLRAGDDVVMEAVEAKR